MDFSLLWSNSGTSTTFEKVLVCFFIGIVFASILVVFERSYIGKLVRRLLKREASTPETALTLKKCGYPKNPFIRLALRRKDSSLRKIVSCTSDKKVLKKEDFDEAKFYITEENNFRADEAYNAKHTNIFIIIFCAIAMFIVLSLVLKYYPNIVEKYNKLFNKAD